MCFLIPFHSFKLRYWHVLLLRNVRMSRELPQIHIKACKIHGNTPVPSCSLLFILKGTAHYAVLCLAFAESCGWLKYFCVAKNCLFLQFMDFYVTNCAQRAKSVKNLQTYHPNDTGFLQLLHEYPTPLHKGTNNSIFSPIKR